jgi:hypothetical protein
MLLVYFFTDHPYLGPKLYYRTVPIDTQDSIDSLRYQNRLEEERSF